MCPKTVKDLDKKIIGYLNEKQWPVTTEDVGKALKLSWQTVQIHLFKLASERKVEYRKVGRQNQWWLTENYRKFFSK